MKQDFKYFTKDNKIILSYRNWVTGSQNRHLHETYEVLYVINGKRKMFIDGEEFEMKSGEIIIIPPNTIHKSFDNFDGSEIYNLYFNSECNGFNNKPFIIDSSSIKFLMKNIITEFEKKDLDYEIMLKSYCVQILIINNREQNTPMNSINKNNNSTINSIIKFINTNYKDDLNLSNISKQYNYTPEYLSRLFPQKTGFNLVEFINHVRIKNAKRLLNDKTLKINEVCFLCGFGSITHFGRVFKGITGYSPREFKKQTS